MARLELIMILLSIACHLKFKVFQMDVKSAFLNCLLQEEVYVEQPEGFVNPHKPNHVYRLRKALYGLKQAPRAWYERLTKFLLNNQFSRGSVDKTLFIKKKDDFILIAQIYVDDIIFGATREDITHEFSHTMKNEFEMSMKGELMFFLGLQTMQTKDDIFVNQSKFARELGYMFGMTTSKPLHTPISTNEKVNKDAEGKEVDTKMYRSMISSLLYLTANRPEISFSVGVCARH